MASSTYENDCVWDSPKSKVMNGGVPRPSYSNNKRENEDMYNRDTTGSLLLLDFIEVVVVTCFPNISCLQVGFLSFKLAKRG